MRIAQLAPLAESIPPKLYGGTERVISWLTEELVELGHDVTLFAAGDSKTRARLEAVWPRSLRLARQRTDPAAAQAALLDAIANRAADFDIIHAHLEWAHMPLLSRTGIPFLTTLHGRLDTPGLAKIIERFPNAPLVSISNSQRDPLPSACWFANVYHGLPRALFQARLNPGDYLGFLGRLAPEKGPRTAIELARAAQMPLRIAAKIPRAEAQYFKDELQPMIDGHQIRLVGEVNERDKQEFLGGAAALLFPIDWPEPFGLVMIEAMACGTPVIAFRRGSVPEIIEDGVNGFIVDSEEEALDRIKNIRQISRAGVRHSFEQRFTARRMAENYIAVYQRLAGSASRTVQGEAMLSVLTAENTC